MAPVPELVIEKTATGKDKRYGREPVGQAKDGGNAGVVEPCGRSLARPKPKKGWTLNPKP